MCTVPAQLHCDGPGIGGCAPAYLWSFVYTLHLSVSRAESLEVTAPNRRFDGIGSCLLYGSQALESRRLLSACPRSLTDRLTCN